MIAPDSDILELVIVGAGFSGLGMAIRARRAGIARFAILEKAPEVGGTWRENTYPGAASDVPVQLYTLSFAPQTEWSRLYPRQPEIQAYLKGLVDRHGLAGHLRLGTALRGADWDEASGLWRIETDRGHLRARSLVLAVGGLHQPALPAIEGLDRFASPAFHTARWDHDCALDGKRVGVIGTGASAVQVVPEIVGRTAHLTLFQRSAPWVLPQGDRPARPWERGPLARRLARAAQFWQHEFYALAGFTRVSGLTQAGEAIGRRHLRAQVADARLRAALTPRYRLGCKRVLVSDDYYPALTRSDASVVTAPIEAVLPHGVRTTDGAEHPLDVLILATGFDTGGSFARIALRGRGGLTLSEAWRAGGDAFQGIAVSGFPNLFLLLGPNTGLGHNSVLLMVEAQIAHVLDGLRHLRAHPDAVLDVRPQAQARFRAGIDALLADSVWSKGGCMSWYRDVRGANRTLWPRTVLAYRREAGRLRLADYDTARRP